jgi:hypothetical protein
MRISWQRQGNLCADSRLVDLEENLEALIVIAQSERRNFLAYLLFMALMEAHASSLRNGAFFS